MSVERLDSRAWLGWGLATMTPLLLSRNPWVLIQVLVIVAVVRAVWHPATAGRDMAWFLKIAAAFVTVSVAFNVLTVHAGDRIISELPVSWPVVGGILTWNALVYGILGGIALFTLVLTGITASSLISWIDLFHVMPRRLAPIAVTGSVAWAFLPQTAIAWRQIREAQVMRGHRFRRARDFIPIVVPLLAGGLDRSLAMAEALESRGFGVSPDARPKSANRWRNVASSSGLIVGLVGLAVASYCLAVGQATWAIVAATLGIVALVLAARATPDRSMARTRYRELTWTRANSLVSGASLIVMAMVIFWNSIRSGSLAYQVYPTMNVPPADLPLLLILGLLLAPALVFRPAGREG
ncbi:MAG: energy-coupling factor transporter transmembrane protein EcfT [Chloroflexia bacterium]|nr:energy-coupling factor transporter transmembrane protein EcfT [Chloroflexia bacterium]